MMGRAIRSRWRWLILALLSIPVLVLFWEIVLAGRVLFWGVPMMQFGPWYEAALTAVRAGEWPLWNPLLGNGAPLLANYQTAPFYPPNWLHLLVEPARAMSWLMILHVVWAGAGAWMYARQIGLRQFGRLVNALSFMLSGYLISRLAFPSIGSTLPWLPWTLWAGERLWQKGSLQAAVLLALCLAMQWLAGHAQTSFYTALLLGGYGLWRILGQRSIPRAQRAKLLLLAVAATLLAAGLAAIQLLPTAELLQLSQRASGVESEKALTYSLWPLRVIALLTPRFFGHPSTAGGYWGYCCNYWEDNGYVGLLPLLLAVGASIAWILDRRRKEPGSESVPSVGTLVPFYLLLAVVGLVLAFGVHTPVYPLVARYMPGFAQFQAPARLLVWWTWSISALAGIGAEQWRPSGRVKRLARYGLVVGLALIIAGLAATQMLGGKTQSFVVGVGQLGLGLICASGLALRQPRQDEGFYPSTWVLAALVFVAADLVAANWGGVPTADPILYKVSSTSAATLRAAGLDGRTYYPAEDEYKATFTCQDERPGCERYLSFQSYGPRDLDYWLDFRETLLPDMGALDRFPSANNFDPLLNARYAALREAVDAADDKIRIKLLRMMAVQTLITVELQPGLTGVHSNRDVVFSAVPEPLPRVYAVYQAQVVDSPDEALDAVRAPDFDPTRAVVLEVDNAPELPRGSGEETATARVLTMTPNSVTIRVALAADGVVVLLDTYFPGWLAQVDGQPAPIYPANLAFRGVLVPAGEHLVEFRYRPVSFSVGAVTSLVSLFSVAALLLWHRAVSRREIRA